MFMKLKQGLAIATVVATLGLSPAASEAQEGKLAIEEITVTAQKRAQSLQDVSLSVTAFNGDDLAKAGIDDLSRVELATAGVTYGFIGSDAKINIRGANADNTFSDAYPIAGLFIDGVYRPRAAQQSQPFFDVERLEILKGPQGTLYGRSTFMGAINLINRRPDTEEMGGYFKAGIARFGKFTTEGAFNIPVSDNFALRAAVHTSDSDGHIKNEGPGGDLAQDDSLNYRVSALWAPTDNVEAYVSFTSISEEGTTAGIFAAEGLCRPVNDAGIPDVFGQDINCDNVVPNSPTNFRAPNTVAYDVPNFRDNFEENLTLDINWDISDSWTARYIGSWTEFESLTDFDADFSPTVEGVYFWDEEIESVTSELQLIYQGDGPVSATGGLYYSVDEIGYGFSQLRQPAGGSVDTYADWQDIETTTEAAFVQAEFAVSDTTRLIGGVRFNDEEKDVESFVGCNFAGGLDDNGNPLPGVNLGTLGRAGLDGRPRSDGIYRYCLFDSATKVASWDEVTWRLGAEYDFGEDILLYGHVSTGFLSGGVLLFGDDLDQQESKAYEIGIKTRLANGRVQLNIAAYRNELTALTTEKAVLVGGAFVTLQENAGDSTTHGLEVELDWLPSENWFVSTNLSVIDAEYETFGVSNNLQQANGVDSSFLDQSGTTPPFAPAVTLGTTVSYDFDLGESGRLTPRLQSYFSSEYGTDNETLYSTQQQDSFTKTDFSLAWTSANERISATAFIENMEDSEVLARTNIGGASQVQGGYLYPRNYGVKFSYMF